MKKAYKFIITMFVLLCTFTPNKLSASSMKYFVNNTNQDLEEYYLDNGKYEVLVSKEFNDYLIKNISNSYLTGFNSNSFVFDEKVSVYANNGIFYFGNFGYVLKDGSSHPVVVEFIFDQKNNKLYLNNTALDDAEKKDWKAIVEEVPNTVIPLEVKQIYTESDYSELERGGGVEMSLPWKTGTSWRLTGGAHGLYSGGTAQYYHNQNTFNKNYSVWNALDFSGPKNTKGQYTDKKIRSIADGTIVSVYKNNNGIACQLSIRHGSNVYVYLHLGNNGNKNYYVGQKISAQEVLGDISNNCGQSTGPHVHFALKNNTNTSPVEIGGLKLGGYTVSSDYLKNNVKTYDSCLERNRRKFCSGNYLYNYTENNNSEKSSDAKNEDNNYYPTKDQTGSRSKNREKAIISNKNNKLKADTNDMKLIWDKGIYIEEYEVTVKNNRDQVIFRKKNIDDSDSSYRIKFNEKILTEIKKGNRLEFKVKSVYEDGKDDDDSFKMDIVRQSITESQKEDQYNRYGNSVDKSRSANRVKGKIISRYNDIEDLQQNDLNIIWKKGIYIENYNIEITIPDNADFKYLSKNIDDSDNSFKLPIEVFKNINSNKNSLVNIKLVTTFEDGTLDRDVFDLSINNSKSIAKANNESDLYEPTETNSLTTKKQAKINTKNVVLDMNNNNLKVSWDKGIYVDRYELVINVNDKEYMRFRQIDDSRDSYLVTLTSKQIEDLKGSKIAIKLLTVYEDGLSEQQIYNLKDSNIIADIKNTSAQKEKAHSNIDYNKSKLDLQNGKIILSWLVGERVIKYNLFIYRNNQLVGIHRNIDKNLTNKVIEINDRQKKMYYDSEISIKLVSVFDDNSEKSSNIVFNTSGSAVKESSQISDTINKEKSRPVQKNSTIEDKLIASKSRAKLDIQNLIFERENESSQSENVKEYLEEEIIPSGNDLDEINIVKGKKAHIVNVKSNTSKNKTQIINLPADLSTDNYVSVDVFFKDNTSYSLVSKTNYKDTDNVSLEYSGADGYYAVMIIIEQGDKTYQYFVLINDRTQELD